MGHSRATGSRAPVTRRAATASPTARPEAGRAILLPATRSMRAHSGNFRRVDDDIPHPKTWLGGHRPALADAVGRLLGVAAAWRAASRRRRTARCAARAEDLRIDWWRSH